KPGTEDLVPGHAFQVHIDLMRPTSTGHVKLRSPNPTDAPEVLFNYLQTERDREDMRNAARHVRDIIGQAAFDDFRGEESTPGKEATTDEDLAAWARQMTETGYHAAGTCRMGPADGNMNVVDPE